MSLVVKSETEDFVNFELEPHLLLGALEQASQPIKCELQPAFLEINSDPLTTPPFQIKTDQEQHPYHDDHPNNFDTHQNESEIGIESEEWKLQQNLSLFHQSTSDAADSILSSFQSSLAEAKSSLSKGGPGPVSVTLKSRIQTPVPDIGRSSNSDFKRAMPTLLPMPNLSLPVPAPVPATASVSFPIPLELETPLFSLESLVEQQQQGLYSVLPNDPNHHQQQQQQQQQVPSSHSVLNSDLQLVQNNKNLRHQTRTRTRSTTLSSSDGTNQLPVIPPTSRSGFRHSLNCPSPSCSRRFDKPKHLNYHYRTKHCTCTLCHERLPSESERDEHYRNFHKVNPNVLNHTQAYTCCICNEALVSIRDLNEHYATYHKIENPDLLNETVYKAVSQYQPSQRQQPRPPLPQLKAISTGNNSSSNENRNSINGAASKLKSSPELNFDPKMFELKLNRRNQEEPTNQNMFLYKCPHCVKTYHSKHSLRIHMDGSHSNNANRGQRQGQNASSEKKKFSCPFCTKTFASAHGLKTHIGMSHDSNSGSVDSLTCRQCPKKFSRQWLLTRHMSSVHTKPGNGGSTVVLKEGVPSLNEVPSLGPAGSNEPDPLPDRWTDAADPFSGLEQEEASPQQQLLQQLGQQQQQPQSQHMPFSKVNIKVSQPEIIDLSSDSESEANPPHCSAFKNNRNPSPKFKSSQQSHIDIRENETEYIMGIDFEGDSEFSNLISSSNSRTEISDFDNDNNSHEDFGDMDTLGESELEPEPEPADGDFDANFNPGDGRTSWVFPCNAKDCPLTFPTPQDLNHHERNHLSCVWACKLCHKLFRQNHMLKRHMTIHTGESKHRCPVCPKYYTKRWNLRLHLATHESESRGEAIQINCPYCQGIFYGFTPLKVHLDTYANCITGTRNIGAK